jgi:hypothetical protein
MADNMFTLQPDSNEAYGVSEFGNMEGNPDYYRGWFNTVQQHVDPLITGYAFVKWYDLPTWVTDFNSQFTNLTEKNLRAFDLPGDIEINKISSQAGFSTEETEFAGSIGKPTGFQMTHKEFSGSPIRHAYSHWVSGIRDPKTGVATYPLFSGLEYAAVNHTGSLLYVMTRPDATNFDNAAIIEFAAYFTNVMPTKIPLGHLNFSAGSNDAQEIQMSFTGMMHFGQSVTAFAAAEMQTTIKGVHGNYQYDNNVEFR